MIIFMMLISSFKYANPERHIQPKVVEEEKGGGEEEEREEQITKGNIEEQQCKVAQPIINKLNTSREKKRYLEFKVARRRKR